MMEDGRWKMEDVRTQPSYIEKGWQTNG